jgi:hypothetical protein
MCAERDPLDCHRCLLVARALAGRGMTIGHILHDGRIEPHTAIEKRLVELANEECDLFATGQDGQLTAAYRRRSRAVAYRARGAQRVIPKKPAPDLIRGGSRFSDKITRKK